MPQAEAAHCVLAFCALHALPHAPHALFVEERSVSQPLTALPSQSAQVPTQVNEHALFEHSGVACGGVGQTLPHLPQLEALVCVFISQPLAALPSQSAKPALQPPMPHTPFAQVALALAGAGQTLPQAPQFCVVWSDTSQPFA